MPKNFSIDPQNSSIVPQNSSIMPKNSSKKLVRISFDNMENNYCGYCQKKFTRKDNLIRHIDNTCKIKNDIEKHKEKIFEELKEENEIKELKEKYEKKIEYLKKESEKEKLLMNKKMMDMEKRLKVLEKINKNGMNIIDKSNNTHYIDNSKHQHLYLVGYNQEDISKIDKKKLIKVIGGYQTPSQMTKLIHFNKTHPEYHNVYIPKINEKYGMIYKNEAWKLIDKDELASDIYETKRSYIIENLEDLKKDLSETQIKKLTKFLETPDDDIAIKNTKNQIKEILYENRKMAINRKNEIEKYKKNINIDIYQRFLFENTEKSNTHIKIIDLYKSFIEWCGKEWNGKIPSKHEFGLNLKKYVEFGKVKISNKSCRGIKKFKFKKCLISS